MAERLRRCGVQAAFSAVVDVTNYVMLDIGQPMHAFNLDRLPNWDTGIIVRQAEPRASPSTLLDGSSIDVLSSTVPGDCGS